MPSKESIVRRLNFCQWVDADNPWMSSDVWMGCEEDFDLQELQGEECYGGLDLSGTRDLTSLALFFPKKESCWWSSGHRKILCWIERKQTAYLMTHGNGEAIFIPLPERR